MRTRYFFISICLALIALAFTAMAQIEGPANRLSLSYRPGFNIKADFKNRGQEGVSGGPSVTGLSYEDGFVRPNSEPNDLGLSWNWGYQSANQIVGDNIVMTSSQKGKIASGKEDAPANGVELAYNRQIGFWGSTPWGLEGAINYTGVSIDNSASPGVLTAHAFSLGGSVPPVAPYAGTPEGPGVLISDSPTTASLRAHSSLDTSLLGFRFGPYLDFPMSDSVSLSLSGGFALAWADSELDVRETVTVGPDRGTTRKGSGSESEWLPGYFVGANLTVKVYKTLGIVAGVQFQDVGDHNVRALDKEAKLKLSASVFITAGLNYSF